MSFTVRPIELNIWPIKIHIWIIILHIQRRGIASIARKKAQPLKRTAHRAGEMHIRQHNFMTVEVKLYIMQM